MRVFGAANAAWAWQEPNRLAKGCELLAAASPGHVYGTDRDVAYVLNAVISNVEALKSVGVFVVVPLGDGLGLAPLTDGFWREHGHGSQPLRRVSEGRNAPGTDFEKPGDRDRQIEDAQAAFARIASICETASAIVPVAYIEADFFGGGGTQAATVWDAQRVVLGPLVEDNAINQALRKIGVQSGIRDEFDTLDLGRCRFTDDWLKLGQINR